MTVAVSFYGTGRTSPTSHANYGVVVLVGGQVVKKIKRWLPDGSSHDFAEWTGAVSAIRIALELGLTTILLAGDTEPIIEQLTDKLKIYAPELIPLYFEAKRLAEKFDKIRYVHLYGEEWFSEPELIKPLETLMCIRDNQRKTTIK